MRFDAHGIGGPQDLPIPAEFAIAGACAALAVSFTVLVLSWRQPRFNTGDGARPAPAALARLVDGRWFLPVARTLGFAVFAWTAFAAVFGKDTVINPFFGVFFVLLWVGVVPMSMLLGPFYKAISPVRTINGLLARVSGSDPDVGLRDYPAGLGYWPAALGLFGFVWFELIWFPGAADLGSARLWCAAYVAVMLLGGAVFGNRFYEHADPFEVYSTLLGHLSPWGREGGRLVMRSPLANLDTVTVRNGLVPVCAVLLGSTAFDSFARSGFWLRRIQDTTVDPVVFGTAGLLALILLVAAMFSAATMLTGIGEGLRRSHLPGLFAHSLVPIVVGYIAAHYLSLLVEYGQTTVIQLSDPLSTGADYLGTADLSVNYWLREHPTFLAVTKVLGVVVGHVLAVIAAHDRAVRLLPRRHQLSGQLPLLLVMVSFTVGGLYLLFGA